MSLVSVALVGRPNVGKSALFNRLAGGRRALVHDKPGMTRDALSMEAKTAAGRPYLLVDTGGLDLDAAGGFAQWTTERTLDAVADADVLVLVIDGVAGLLPEDRRVSSKLRSLGKPVIVAWNKADVKTAVASESEAYQLGFDRVVSVSALHGTGIEDFEVLLDALLPADLAPETRTEPLTITIVGRPNVGKSSIVNALLGKERVMVSEIAGTTRDAIDVAVERNGRRYLLVDTAGIRRKGKTHEAPEILSIVSARKTLERARIAVIVFDASEGITAQDATICGYAEEAGRGLLLVANKWDLIEKDKDKVQELREDVRRRFVFARKAPFLEMSAKTGRSVARLLREADALAERFATRLSTGELNRVITRATEAQTARSRAGRDMKIRYAVQVASSPPLVRLFVDRTEPLHFSFERYLQNRIREKWNLDGVPLKFIVKSGDPAR